MKTLFRLLVTACLITSIAVTANSCAKKKTEPQNISLDQMLSGIEVDLTKLKKETKVPTEDEKAVEQLRNSGKQLAPVIDSLIAKYPNSFILYSFKVYQNGKDGQEAMFKFSEAEYKKDTTNLLRRYFYAVLQPDTAKGIKNLEDFIAQNPENYLGYFGLAQRLMDKNPYDLAKPAKLTYLALLKENKMDEPYYFLSDIFGKLNREEDNAILNGIMLINNPANERAFFNILNYFGKKGEKDKAVTLMESFKKNNPDKLRDLDMAYYLTELKFYAQAAPFLAKVPVQGEDKLYVIYLDAKIAAGTGDKVAALKKAAELAAVLPADQSYMLTDPVISELLFNEKSYITLLKKVEGSAPTIGDKAPALAGKILNGVDFIPQTLSGKVYLIDFWATWCSPCREELPNVRFAYTELKPEGFEVVGINLDTDRAAVAAFVQRYGMKWLQIYSGMAWKDALVQKYQVKGIPATFLVDKKGIIRYKGIRGKELLMEKVKKLLAENAAI